MDELLATRTALFSQLISCGQEVSFWEFDPAMELVSTSSSDREFFTAFLTLDGCTEQLLECVRQGSVKPMILSNSIGFSWIAAFETASGQVSRIYMIGPVFHSDLSYTALNEELFRRQYPEELVTQLRRHVESLPIIPLATWMRYGLMLHYCVTGEKLEVSEFNYPLEHPQPALDEEPQEPPAPKGGTWLAEQTAMRMIEEGQLDYQKVFSKLSMFANVTLTSHADRPTRQQKNAVISFITLSTRAAIRGGLNEEIAYYIGARYIENVEQLDTTADLVQINHTMYDDFVRRVHKVRADQGVSRSIQACCDYIDHHLGEKISIRRLAEVAGYSEFYLAQKFKGELGLSVAQYLKERRVEQAKLLLRGTDRSIQSIAEDLGFCNASYFARAFSDLTGTTPAKYRGERGES